MAEKRVGPTPGIKTGGSGAGSSPKGAAGDGKTGGSGPDWSGLGEELARQLGELGKQVKATFEQVAEEAQYTFDKETAKFMAKHPELYAEIKRTMRQAQKTMDKAAEALGFEKK